MTIKESQNDTFLCHPEGFTVTLRLFICHPEGFSPKGLLRGFFTPLTLRSE
jgi:hypothetical protein